MIKLNYLNGILLSIFVTGVSYADVVIKSPEGSTLTFSKEKKGEHYDKNAWGKIIFSTNSYSVDLSRSDRYYTEDGTSKVSPSGRYLIVISVSGGNVEYGDGTSNYSDKAYCSVIDMTNGCIVSDWDGEACGYTWVGNEDVLASSENAGANNFDFNSMRPSINKIKNKLSTIDARRVGNILRCDVPSKENINSYQQLATENGKTKEIVHESIANYLHGVTEESSIKSKSKLFKSPIDDSETKGYLVSGDKVKVIQVSSDGKWVNVGYINPKGVPLITWVKADTVAE
ncbi:hypothetical protein LVQ78_22440 [Buttiauxella sp. A2-C2_NF]|uniref:hypothetical protein n=1 Tax=Buttiauxella ferragutiae TaxID=82989 RepID=UPI001E2CAAF5|nr:hypothetical protein [Buttiauxella ferragutiae]MCE0828765.1 hypothetical protein [Buttiauxella ferragutiae]UNK63187.1 hypothetical protein MNO13_09865 [Buttiauxella ferragutiae]